LTTNEGQALAQLTADTFPTTTTSAGTPLYTLTQSERRPPPHSHDLKRRRHTHRDTQSTDKKMRVNTFKNASIVHQRGGPYKTIEWVRGYIHKMVEEEVVHVRPYVQGSGTGEGFYHNMTTQG